MESAPPPTASCAPRMPDIDDYPDIFVEEDPIDDEILPDVLPPRVDDNPPLPPPPPPQKPDEPIVPDVTDVVVPKKPEEDEEKKGKLEDEQALKPPSKDLPAFTFDPYESDEEAFLQSLPEVDGKTKREQYKRLLADPEEEQKFYTLLNAALEAYVAETGAFPTRMPIGTPTTVETHHLKAMARVLKEGRWTKEVKKFQATPWENLKQVGLKWILNALHHNTSVNSFHVERANFTHDDALRIVRFIQTSPHITSLAFPQLTNYHDAVLRALLRELPTNKSITHLNLEGALYSETTFNMLLAVLSTNTTLKELNLRYSDFSYHNRAQRFMQAIIDNFETSIEQIHFPLMRGAIVYTAQMLQYNHSLTTIDLSGLSLSTHATLLQKALQTNVHLKKLDLSNTAINDAHLAALLEPLWFNSTLQSLNVSSNAGLGAESARNISEMLMQNSGITSLQLDYLTSIPKDKLAKRLATALRVNSSLHVLGMRSSNTETQGATLLGEALAINHALHSLDLSSNSQFDDSAINALLKGLKTNQGLNKLLLERCKIGDSAVKSLIPWLKTTSTFTVRLDISDNKVSSQSLAALREAIASNPALRKFTLGTPTIQPSLLERLSNLKGDLTSFFSN